MEREEERFVLTLEKGEALLEESLRQAAAGGSGVLPGSQARPAAA